MPEVVELDVVMHCEGCAASVRRAVKRIPGIESYNVDLDAQKVTVVGNVNRADVLRRILKTGKRATLIPKPDPPKEAPKKESKKDEAKLEEKKETKEKKEEKKEEPKQEEKKEEAKAEEKKGETKSPPAKEVTLVHWSTRRPWRYCCCGCFPIQPYSQLRIQEAKVHEPKKEGKSEEKKDEGKVKEKKKDSAKVEEKEESTTNPEKKDDKSKEQDWVPAYVSAPDYTLSYRYKYP